MVYEVGDIVKLKKPHPAEARSGRFSEWELISDSGAWAAATRS